MWQTKRDSTCMCSEICTRSRNIIPFYSGMETNSLCLNFWHLKIGSIPNIDVHKCWSDGYFTADFQNLKFNINMRLRSIKGQILKMASNMWLTMNFLESPNLTTNMWLTEFSGICKLTGVSSTDRPIFKPAKPLHNRDIVSVHFNHFHCMRICDKLSRRLSMLPYIYLNVYECWLTSSTPQ